MLLIVTYVLSLWLYFSAAPHCHICTRSPNTYGSTTDRCQLPALSAPPHSPVVNSQCCPHLLTLPSSPAAVILHPLYSFQDTRLRG
jgi:hypothetical protein